MICESAVKILSLFCIFPKHGAQKQRVSQKSVEVDEAHCALDVCVIIAVYHYLPMVNAANHVNPDREQF